MEVSSSSLPETGLSFHKMPSGGRGEYEVVGRQGDLGAVDLNGRTFTLRSVFGDKETNLYLGNQGGKRRLRSLGPEYPQIQRQIAALHMLPRSTRDETAVSSARPILLSGRYIMDIEFDLLVLDEESGTVEPRFIVARSGDLNDEGAKVRIDCRERSEELLALFSRAAFLPPPLNNLVAQLWQAISSGTHVGLEAERIVGEIISNLGDSDFDYLPGSDPLPILKSLAGISAVELTIPEPPETPLDDPEIQLRSEHIYRLRRIRGASATSFKKDVQRAYDFRCAFCGLRAPRVPGRLNPGVDAAHILPYGDYDLDVTVNGIMLCKQHHWAFDNHVLILSHMDGDYFVNLNQDAIAALDNDAVTLDLLTSATGRIDESRLPRRSLRPSPTFIQALYDGR